MLALLFIATVFLAYSNGANDNFKGVATLFGSGATDYKKAIWWATITQLGGSICAIFFAQQLVKNYSGADLVPNDVAASTAFLLAVGLAAALTVILATLTGFPISTTHALTGGLVGSGFVAVGTAVNFSTLGVKFFLPLLSSPIIAAACGAMLYCILHGLRTVMGVTEETCVCADPVVSASAAPNAVMAFTAAPLKVTVDTTANCARQYKGSILGIACQPVVDGAHFLSAGAVCFARALNDTPKIVAIMLLIKSISTTNAMVVIAIGMAVGGLLNAKRVAETMSKKITRMNHGQGFTANLVTATLVIFASKIGVPVSTTHVAVGSITGMGLMTKKANLKVIGQIALSWVLTVPIAAGLSAAIYFVITRVA